MIVRNFKLFLQVFEDFIPISSSNSVESFFSTYDEVLNEQENSQYTLSFSLPKVKIINSIKHTNPLFSYFFIGAKLRIIIDDYKTIDLIINSIIPQNFNSDSIYNFTAKDEVSFLWSRHNIGYSYTTYASDGVTLEPKDIFTICHEVLKDNHIYDWKITKKSVDIDLMSLRTVLEISNSNPYNILVEAANNFDANIDFDYTTHTIDFYRKKILDFSGYRYYPSAINSFSAQNSGDQLATILHVTGGTDAKGNQITITPYMPKTIKNFIIQNIEKNPSKFENIKYFASQWHTMSEEKKSLYYPSFNPAFVPIANVFELNYDGYWHTSQIENYIVEQNFTSGKYEGKIHYKSVQVYNTIDTMIFTINPNGKIPSLEEEEEEDEILFFEGFDEIREIEISLDGNENNKKKYIQYSNGKIKLYQEKYSVENYINSLKEIENENIEKFISIIEKNPYLDQSLIDFKYFTPYMSNKQKEELAALYNQMSQINAEILFYSEEYYNLIYELSLLRSKFITYGQLYSQSLNLYKQAKEDTANAQEGEENINKYKQDFEKSEQNLKTVIKNSNYINILYALGKAPEFCIDSIGNSIKDNYFLKEKEQQKSLIELYSKQIIINSNSDSVDTTAYYSNLKSTLEELCNDVCIDNTTKLNMYDFINTEVNNMISSSATVQDIYNIYNNLLEQKKYSVIEPLYANFGQYIYEQTYENNETIDSVDLFNQAYEYFENLKNINTSYSLEALDIGSLIQIDIPRLSIGNQIQVYNKNSIKTIPYASLLGEIEKINNLIDFYTFNYDKDRIDYYNKKKNFLEEQLKVLYQRNKQLSTEPDTLFPILEDIYFDEVNITGIQRTLREPEKDSVTVEPIQQYKTILSKLIKSI